MDSSGLRGARAAMVGLDLPASDLVRDVLEELEVSIVADRGGRPDLVIVQVDARGQLPRSLARGPATPLAKVVALLPYPDELLERRLLRSGADGCFSMGTTLQNLRALVARLLSGGR